MLRLDSVLALSSVIVLSVGCGSSSGSKKDSGTDSATTSDGPAADVASSGDVGAPDTGVTADSGGADTAAGDTATAGDGGASDSAAGDSAAGDSAASDSAASDSAAGDAGANAAVMRGQYLVGVLGCANCHTPKVAGTMMPDPTMTLAGVDCFVSTPGCLSSANLTPDMDTGIGGFTDQALVDALRTGKEPDPKDAGKYLSSRMPFYQFANLSDVDATAIVAYLRTLTAVKHSVKVPTAPFDVAPPSPEWTAVDPTKLPAPGASAPADAANGKYLATIMCVTCHSPAAAGTPKHVAEATAFQGGQASTLMSNGMTVMFESANLTPDASGLLGWSAQNIVTAIKTAKDKMGATLCAPMRANAAISDADATGIADYLISIPSVAHATTACSARQ
jgi:mono/diheme cytochrome c family protein